MKQNRPPAKLATMSVDEYLRERVDDQLNWYGKKSASNKSWYFRLQLFTLVVAASIPVISLSFPDSSVRVVVAVMGALTAIAAGAITLYQFKDQWIDYRATAETLKFEKYLFLTRSEPYTKPDVFSLFVNRVEAIIIQENKGWRDKKFNSEPESMPAVAEQQSIDQEEKS